MQVNPQSSVSPNAQNTSLLFASTGPSALLFANFLAANSDQPAGVSTPVMPHAGEDSSASVNIPLMKKNIAGPAPIGKNKTTQEKNDRGAGSGASLPAPFAIPVPVDVSTWTPIQPPSVGNAATSRNEGNAIDVINSQPKSSSVDAAQSLSRRGAAERRMLPDQVGGSITAAKTLPGSVTGDPIPTTSGDSPTTSIPGSEEELAASPCDEEEPNLPEARTEYTIDEAVAPIAASSPPQVAACMPGMAISSAVPNDSPNTSDQLNAASAGDVAVPGPSLSTGTTQSTATNPNSATLPNSPSGVAIPYSIHQLTGAADTITSSAAAVKSSFPPSFTGRSKPSANDAIRTRSAPQAQIADFTQANLAQNPVSGPLAAQCTDHQAQTCFGPSRDENKASCDLVTNAELKKSGMHTSSHDGATHSEKSNAATNSAGAKTFDSKPVQVTEANVSNADTDAQSASAQSNPGLPSPSLVQPALSSNALQDPAAAQTSAPAVSAPQMTHSNGTKADALPSSIAKPMEGPQPYPSANSSVQGVRFIQNAEQAEMRVGVRTESFGTVQVHTSISDKSVDVTLGSEHGDLKSFMVSELPALQSALQQHDLRLQQLRTVLPSYSPQSDMFAGNGGQSRQSQQQGGRPAVFQFRGPSSEVDEVPRVNGGGLSIRA